MVVAAATRAASLGTSYAIGVIGGGGSLNAGYQGKEFNMAKMLGAWIYINNPGRPASEDLNLTVGGTIILTAEDVRKLTKGQLFAVRIKVMDDDSFSDDEVFTDNSFSVGVYDTSPKCFHTGVIVPHGKLSNSEPSYEDWAEIYCRVSASQGTIKTNGANSQNEDVRI